MDGCVLISEVMNGVDRWCTPQSLTVEVCNFAQYSTTCIVFSSQRWFKCSQSLTSSSVIVRLARFQPDVWHVHGGRANLSWRTTRRRWCCRIRPRVRIFWFRRLQRERVPGMRAAIRESGQGQALGFAVVYFFHFVVDSYVAHPNSYFFVVSCYKKNGDLGIDMFIGLGTSTRLLTVLQPLFSLCIWFRLWIWRTVRQEWPWQWPQRRAMGPGRFAWNVFTSSGVPSKVRSLEPCWDSCERTPLSVTSFLVVPICHAFQYPRF